MGACSETGNRTPLTFSFCGCDAAGDSDSHSSFSPANHILHGNLEFLPTGMQNRRFLFGFVLFCSNLTSRGNVCLHDKRVRDTHFESPDHHFDVPGDYYDSVITGIFGEMRRSGSEVFTPVNTAGQPAESADVEGDHEQEVEGGEGEHTLAYIALIMMFSLTVIIVQARLLPSFPTPISTLFTGVLFAVIYKQTSPFGPKSDHMVNIVCQNLHISTNLF